MQLILRYNPYQLLDYSKEPARSCLYINEDLLEQYKANWLDIHKENESLEQCFDESLEFVLSPAAFHPSDVAKLRLIRVLYLDDQLESSSTLVEALKSLNHLRYLEIQAYDHFDFEWVSHLCHLQTLKVNLRKHIWISVASFWNMAKLKHVDITNFSFIWEEKDIEYVNNSSCGAPVLLENLKIFGAYNISMTDMNLQFWDNFPNLQKFSIYVEEIEFGNRKISFFPRRQENVRLQSLKICSSISPVSRKIETWHSFAHLFPFYLKDVYLEWVALISEDTLSSLASLPNLVNLRLREVYFAICKTSWDMGDNKFRALKYFKLQNAYRLHEWHCSEDCFPVLERLVLKQCFYLREIPSSFVDIPTLKMIKVIWFNDSLAESARNIKKEVEDITGSCDTLQVLISA